MSQNKYHLKHDNRHFFTEPAQPPADRKTVFARQHEIEHHQVVVLAREPAVHVVAVRDGAHAESLVVQISVQQIAQACIVIEELLSRCPTFTVDPVAGRYAPGPYVRRYESLPFVANGA